MLVTVGMMLNSTHSVSTLPCIYTIYPFFQSLVNINVVYVPSGICCAWLKNCHLQNHNGKKTPNADRNKQLMNRWLSQAKVSNVIVVSYPLLPIGNVHIKMRL